MNNTIIGKNKYGSYCIPIKGKHRISAKTVLNNGIYEPDTIQFMIENSPNDIIHAGTFFGDFLPALSNNCNGNIWAFEPSIENFHCAMQTCKLNNLQNIKLYNGALGNSDIDLNLSYEKDNKFRGGNCTIVNDSSDSKTYKVKQYRIDDVILSNTKISILQLDVEGYEEFALQGAIQTITRCKPIIILETDCKEILSNLSYKFYKKLHHNYVYIYDHITKI